MDWNIAAFVAVVAIIALVVIAAFRAARSKGQQASGPLAALPGKHPGARPGESASPTVASRELHYGELRVLVVDDYKTMRLVMRQQLRQVGFRDVEQAASGAEALQKLRSGDFGLVVSDWRMSPMTGLQLLQEMHADDKLRQIPVIMASGSTGSDKIVAAREAGASGYLVKPFSVEELKSMIDRIFHRT